MSLSKSHRLLLEMIYAHDGEWNWYKLGRACLGRLDSPADFTLTPLLHSGLVEEVRFENEPLPRLRITAAGKAVLDPCGPEDEHALRNPVG